MCVCEKEKEKEKEREYEECVRMVVGNREYKQIVATDLSVCGTNGKSHMSCRLPRHRRRMWRRQSRGSSPTEVRVVVLHVSVLRRE